MPLIACNEVVGTGFVGTFQKSVVIRITAHIQAVRRGDDMAMVLDELEQFQAEPLRAGRTDKPTIRPSFPHSPSEVFANSSGVR